MSEEKTAWQKHLEKKNGKRPVSLVDALWKENYSDDKELTESRFSICQSCEFFIKATSQCKKCGCFMKIKTKLKDAECPIQKW